MKQDHDVYSWGSYEPLVLVGLGTIARAVGAGQQALRRWIREENFPAKRCTDGIYRAEPGAIRHWFRVSSSSSYSVAPWCVQDQHERQ